VKSTVACVLHCLAAVVYSWAAVDLVLSGRHWGVVFFAGSVIALLCAIREHIRGIRL
jgi:hypothetical protein